MLNIEPIKNGKLYNAQEFTMTHREFDLMHSHYTRAYGACVFENLSE